MTKNSIIKMFDDMADSYDGRYESLAPIMDHLHLLLQFILMELPQKSHVLCVGAGTGTEIIKMATLNPQWHFTIVEPSLSMLDICRKKLTEHGIISRCEIHEGYIESVPIAKQFDAITCLLVTQFLTDPEKRQNLFYNMAAKLKKGAYLINAEISHDQSSASFSNLFKKWKAMHRYSGASEESLEAMLETMSKHVAIEPPEEIERMIKQADMTPPIQFYQSLLIRGWYSQKK